MSKNAEIVRGYSIPEFVATDESVMDLSLVQLLSKYGSYDTYQTGLGDMVTVLPTCTVPLDYLLRENWAQTCQMGHCRSVRSIDSLKNGTNPHLVVKSPERVFTAELFERGQVWWGGSRSGDKGVRIENNLSIEQQAIWEAAILLELVHQGFNTETPQALIKHPGGQFELVVSEIQDCFRQVKRGPSYQDLIELIRSKTSLRPEDVSPHNCISDENGYEYIIDVNRWLWPPYTDYFAQRRFDIVREATAPAVLTMPMIMSR